MNQIIVPCFRECGATSPSGVQKRKRRCIQIQNWKTSTLAVSTSYRSPFLGRFGPWFGRIRLRFPAHTSLVLARSPVYQPHLVLSMYTYGRSKRSVEPLSHSARWERAQLNWVRNHWQLYRELTSIPPVWTLECGGTKVTGERISQVFIHKLDDQILHKCIIVNRFASWELYFYSNFPSVKYGSETCLASLHLFHILQTTHLPEP